MTLFFFRKKYNYYYEGGDTYQENKGEIRMENLDQVVEVFETGEVLDTVVEGVEQLPEVVESVIDVVPDGFKQGLDKGLLIGSIVTAGVIGTGTLIVTHGGKIVRRAKDMVNRLKAKKSEVTMNPDYKE